MLEERLFNGTLDAWTTEIIFVKGSLDELVDEDLRQWSDLPPDLVHYEDGERPSKKQHRLSGDLKSSLHELEPYCFAGWKQLWVSCRNGWVAHFAQGAMPHRAVTLATNLGTSAVHTRFYPNVERRGEIVSYGVCTFALYESNVPLRYIEAAHYEDGWKWSISGPQQEFEDVERYNQKRISQRFDIEMLNQYCAALGIRRSDESFYGPNAVMVEISQPDVTDLETMTADEWLQRYR